MVERPPKGTIPDGPGSYQFYDGDDRVIYVGKAKSLRSRLSSYFGHPSNLHPRTQQMLFVAQRVEWVQVDNEVEALILEYNLIKKHSPRFNVRLIDDKSYPYIAMKLSEKWPRPRVYRGKLHSGTQYFGPYAHAYSVRSTLDELLKSFPLRSCSDAKLERHTKENKPCLLYHIEKCSAPCIGAIDQQNYQGLVSDFCDFLEGDTKPVTEKLTAQMKQAASEQNFELAARLRNRLEAVDRTTQKQQMMTDSNESFDVIGLTEDDLQAAVYLLKIRKGQVTGQQSFVLDKVEPLNNSELIDKVIEGVYSFEREPPPKLILVPHKPSEPDLYESWLSDTRGSAVSIKVPHRGPKVSLAKTATQNAAAEFRRHRLKRAGDHNARAKALNELQDRLMLSEAPLRIECYDMSHIQGTNYVGSMVVAEDGLMKTSEFRRFKIQTVDHNDDYAAMAEVLSRRLGNYVDDQKKAPSQRGKFQYKPNLLMVDGGKGQLGIAVEALEKFGLTDTIAVCSLAKRLEEVFIYGRPEPIVLPRDSEALYLLQRLRDESHRFAVEYHRKLRAKEMTKSELDAIVGLGPARKKRLLEEFGSLAKIKRASEAELKALQWLPDQVAEAIFTQFH